MEKMKKTDRTNNLDNIMLQNHDEDLEFIEWKTELNKELRFFWTSMIK